MAAITYQPGALNSAGATAGRTIMQTAQIVGNLSIQEAQAWGQVIGAGIKAAAMFITGGIAGAAPGGMAADGMGPPAPAGGFDWKSGLQTLTQQAIGGGGATSQQLQAAGMSKENAGAVTLGGWGTVSKDAASIMSLVQSPFVKKPGSKSIIGPVPGETSESPAAPATRQTMWLAQMSAEMGNNFEEELNILEAVRATGQQ